MTQESKFKENLSSIQDTFVRLTRESDDRIMDINSQFRQESQKILEASKNNVQNFVAINEEVSMDSSLCTILFQLLFSTLLIISCFLISICTILI